MEQRHLPPLATALPQYSGGFYVVSGSSLNYTNGLEAFSFVCSRGCFFAKGLLHTQGITDNQAKSKKGTGVKSHSWYLERGSPWFQQLPSLPCTP
jgi:hypothetical protein